LLAVVAILGVSFFLLLRSADKKLEGIKAKSKRKNENIKIKLKIMKLYSFTVILSFIYIIQE